MVMRAARVILGLLGVVSPALRGVHGGRGSGRKEPPRRLAEAPALGSCTRPGDKIGGAGTVVRDDAVQTSVDIIGTDGDHPDGFSTYQVKLHLASGIESVYSIFGTDENQMRFPPAYQCPAPFGVDVGGVNPAFFEVAQSDATGFAQYDSWLTVGLTTGDGSNSMSSLGIDFRRWDEEHELVSDAGTGGAVFWMEPHLADVAVSADRTVVVAQLTLTAEPGNEGTNPESGTVVRDWQTNCITVMIGGSQNGQGSHSVGSQHTAGVTPTPAPPAELAPEVAHCNFEYHAEQKTWQDAEDDCARRSDGGHLASITSPAEQDVLHGLVEVRAWIGLNDILAEALCDGDSFLWAGGSEPDYSNWADNAPNNFSPDDKNSLGCGTADNDEDCVEVFAFRHASDKQSPLWDDKNCELALPYVCATPCDGRSPPSSSGSNTPPPPPTPPTPSQSSPPSPPPTAGPTLPPPPGPMRCETSTGSGATVNDNAVTTSVESIATVSLDGVGDGEYTVYQITLHLSDIAASAYTIFGTTAQRLSFPAAYQCAAPFGVDVAGVNPAFFPVANSASTGYAQYDSWLTLGITEGDTNNDLSQIGLDFASWDQNHELLSASDTGGAVFCMNPDDAVGLVSAERTMVIAQLTVPASSASHPALFGAQGRSHVRGEDWVENCISVMVGGVHNGEGTHAIGGSGVHAPSPTPTSPPPSPLANGGSGTSGGLSVKPDRQAGLVYHSEPLSWLEAELTCVTAGGHLASLHTDTDTQALSTVVGSSEVWIGLNDQLNEAGCNNDPSNQFVWSDGSPGDIGTQWASHNCDEVLAESLDCVAADLDGGNDVDQGSVDFLAQSCTRQMPYVCRIESGGVGAPPSTPVSDTPWLSTYIPSTPECPLQDIRARIAELDAICCADKPGQHNCDPEVLGGAPSTCSAACGAKLTTLMRQCNSTLDILFDGMDDQYDGRAQIFYDLWTSCNELSADDIIGEIKLLQDEGCVVNANGVGEMVVDSGGNVNSMQGDCQDSGSHKMCRLINSGALSCETDFCQDSDRCAHSGACDQSCGFCSTKHGSADGRRALQIDVTHACNALNLQSKVAPVNGACCDEDDACSGGGLGVPTVCDAKCAIVYSAFFDECEATLRASFGTQPQTLAAFSDLAETCSSLPVSDLLEAASNAACPDVEIPDPPDVGGFGAWLDDTIDCPLGMLEQRAVDIDDACCSGASGDTSAECVSGPDGGGPQADCSVSCAASVIGTSSSCQRTFDTVLDGLDGTFDGTSHATRNLEDTCNSISTTTVISHLERMQDSGCVLESAGIDEAAVVPSGDSDCSDTGAHELCSLVDIGVLSCAVDFCPMDVCPHAHACDATCGFCTIGDGSATPAGSGKGNGGHRRTQIDITDTSCDVNDMSHRTAQVNTDCCNDSNDNCAAGVPTTCDAKCAITYITYYTECGQQIAASFSPQQQLQFTELYDTCSALPVGPLLTIVATAQQCPAGMG